MAGHAVPGDGDLPAPGRAGGHRPRREPAAATGSALIERALDICHESNARAYPSALNRAGRILCAAGRIDEGLKHLRDGIAEAERLGDGWFRSANNIEYVEYAYRAWTDIGERRYRDLIDELARTSPRSCGDYGLRDIAARWELLQGHCSRTTPWTVPRTRAISTRPSSSTRAASGSLADESVGSHGSAAIAREFTRFRPAVRPPALPDAAPLVRQA